MSYGLTNITQSPLQARTEAAINHVKKEQNKIKSQQMAFEAGLLDPEMVFRSIGFTNFLSTWLIHQVDPKKMHPSPLVEYVSHYFGDKGVSFLTVLRSRLPLPRDVPMSFRVLPEYIVEDIVDYLFFAVQ
jgi:ubiquitin conjugation factor E4 B